MPEEPPAEPTDPGLPPDPAAEPPLTGDWARAARVAGLTVGDHEGIDRFLDNVNELRRQRVSVVELDGDLSMYLTDEEFQLSLARFNTVAKLCHSRGMRAVVYYPALEVLTPGANATARTMAKEHPDWVQIGIDGKPNVFLGDDGHVFWVEPGMESAWMCPTGGYVPYLISRVKALAASEVDGVWLDVPLLSEIVGQWPCLNLSCRQRFLEKTGYAAPTMVDWTNESFRRWVAWRHEVIWQFEQDILAGARSVRKDFAVITETVTMDYNTATSQGLDGSLRDDGDLFRVWEVDAVSDASSMRAATGDDWMSMGTMMKFARGMSGTRPSWIFCYGLEPPDAERVMSLAVATGNAPYETKIPRMCTTVGAEYRREMFDWIEKHSDLYQASSANPAAVLYSSSSRDYLDQVRGMGLYNSVREDDTLWWTTNLDDTAGALDYMGDYRGSCAALLSAQVPFDVVSADRLTAQTLLAYRLVVVPSAISLSDQAMALLVKYVRSGGTVLLTGTDAGTLDEHGRARGAAQLLQDLQLPAAGLTFVPAVRGLGTVYHVAARAGREHLEHQAPEMMVGITTAALATGVQLGTSPAKVLLDLRRTPSGSLLLLAANMDAAPATGPDPFRPHDAFLTLKVPLPDSRPPTRVKLSEPRQPDGEIAYGLEDGKLVVELRVRSLAALEIQFG